MHLRLKYSRPQIILHWLSAAIIIWATLSGFYVAIVGVADPVSDAIGFFNVSITTVFIPLFILRCYYFLSAPKPTDANANPWLNFIAHATHLLLYVTILVVLITGVLMMERAINVFHLFTLPQPLHDPWLTGLFNRIHIISCAVLAALIALHIAAVIKHEWQNKQLLKRMLP
ncbi:cytochrome b [Serratia sp. AKBS12]|uniref:cytochrome b n=1 Tax=Serratia sp. AKBS12 TaxID=2974597 RepID=UPI002165D26F|nr:cytochrome b/b6 domain-containing protein [Serratia sp. AKBS12]MCS3409169.1 cytochrome b/b6 domain-containing protein [Serratia sp. AKBS12]